MLMPPELVAGLAVPLPFQLPLPTRNQISLFTRSTAIDTILPVVKVPMVATFVLLMMTRPPVE
jgi:hypothetical protein